MNVLRTWLYRSLIDKKRTMKKYLFFLFMTVSVTVLAQPPVERNSAVTNSAEPSVLKETEEVTVPQTATIQTGNEFYKLYQQANSSPEQKNPTVQQQRRMNDFVELNRQEDANGFDYNLSVFMAGNYDLSKKDFLEKAKVLQPKNQYVLLQSVGVSYILIDQATLITDLKELAKQNVWNTDDFSYAKDVLASIPSNGILITHGIHDSYPIIHLQRIEKYRNDVRVIPMHLLQSSEFRKQLSNEDLSIPETNQVNTQYLKEFCTSNQEAPIYLSLTIPSAYFTDMEQRLYPVGLTFRYSPAVFQNSELNTRLWTGMNKGVIVKYKSQTGKQLSANYLPVLLNLYMYYKAENNDRLANEIKNSIRQIGENIGNTNLMKELGVNE